MHEDFVELGDRAKATEKYLAEVQWKNDEMRASNVVINVKIKVADDLTNKTSREAPGIEIKKKIRDGSITLEELDKAIKQLRKGKAPGPDEITTDWSEDLDFQNRQLLLALLNEWWTNEK